ncbi:helix-turn-helix transcriptional regulator [Aeromicrobium piscarium]|uniref:Helix-turn-helix domain-containing protein n=1 Tax=Aeromicrobium piscarium TaxID=2590901 RepID=A0A554SP46_9ACTN|nr:helix-turn-helix domain-containing protein [Aeromicrobium piscarium]TSD68088.1 helix-turn-helix domain-containing protein [Aeromicrobium piscarium]
MSALLTPEQVSDLLGVKTQTLAQWRWRKTGPKFQKVGRLVRYSPEDVDQWLHEGGVAS